MKIMLFKKGDCKDACIGTLLGRLNIKEPGIFIFKDLRFSLQLLEEPIDGHRPLELSYRMEEYMDEITNVTGITFEFEYPKDFSSYITNIKNLLLLGQPVIVVVNHYDYKFSQFYKSLHMPHYIILDNFDGNEFSYVDPFPFYDVSGKMKVEELKELTDNPFLGSHRNVYLLLNNKKQRLIDEDEYVLNKWEAVLEKNVDIMLQQPSVGEITYGVQAIREMARYLELWNNNNPLFDEYQEHSNKFPVNSFLDVGGNRLGHALFLGKLGRTLKSEDLLDVAEQFKKISSYWNTVSSLRHMYQEANIADQYKISPEFIQKKLRKVPLLINEIADKEERALLQLNKFLIKKGVTLNVN